MKKLKSCVAMLLSVLMLFPAQQFPVFASDLFLIDNEDDILLDSSDELTTDSYLTEDDEEPDIITPDTSVPTPDTYADENSDDDILYYNTGNTEYSIIPARKAQNEPGAFCYDDEGNFNIPIDEKNPYFPYQVQFRSGDDTWTEWFVTPSSTVEINGHVIGVQLSSSEYTSITLHVGERDIIVYPEEKSFSDNSGLLTFDSLSLQPLRETYLSTVDLSGISPVLLTMIPVTAIFEGKDVSGSVVWNVYSYDDYDEYNINGVNGNIDLSTHTSSSGSARLEMIVGEADQLAADNIRYIVPVRTTSSRNWLKARAAVKKADGSREEMTVDTPVYYDSQRDDRYVRVEATLSETYKRASDDEYYFSLSNGDIFSEAFSVRFYEGTFTSAEEASKGTEVTSKIWNSDPTTPAGGYKIDKRPTYFTMVTGDENGNVTGCLPFSVNAYVYLYNQSSGFSPRTSYGYLDVRGMYDDVTGRNVSYSTSYSGSDSGNILVKLYKNYPAAGTYRTCLMFVYRSETDTSMSSHNEMVDSAYVGDYATKEEAERAGATNIKDQLFAASITDGFSGVFDAGKTFSVFVKDGDAVTKYSIKITNEEGVKTILNSSTAVSFYNPVDRNGNPLRCYKVDSRLDSYGDFSFITYIVEEDTDISSVAPVFSTATGVRLYGQGGSSPIESGKDYHDFSDGKAYQYTASSENHEFQANYWLQIIKKKDGENLFINSFGDEETGYTVDDNGIIRAKRDMILDSRTGRKHSILVMNMGSQPLKKVKAVLTSDNLVVDEYWTLSGNHDLSQYSGIQKNTSYGELSNLARILVKAKEGVEDGTDLSGTLTLTSEGRTIAVLTLTGTLGDPVITTKEIPDAVKYVHYGTMIMNNNKYKWNVPTYTITGELPEGLELMPNGEIYGVPAETGEFTFGIKMENSYGYSSSIREYTLKVLPNSDNNVDSSTSENYDVIQRIPDFKGNPQKDYTFVSKGLYEEFLERTNVTLDGEYLIPGKDYSHESGSTRITIFKQTLARGKGTHTISVEFRNSNDDFHRAAQNYHINSDSRSSGGSANTGSGSSGNGTGSFVNWGYGSTGSGSSGSGSSGSGSSSSGSSGSGSTISVSPGTGSTGSSTSAIPKLGSCILSTQFRGSVSTPRGNVTAFNSAVLERAQGPLAQIAFNAGTPAGFAQATTFNMLIDGGISYSARSGRLVITLKPEVVKTGRIFALVGLDKNGQPHLFADLDSVDSTVTCNISLEGYAFSLIYSDGINTVRNPITGGTAGVYVVQPRDTLSKIAKKFGTTVANLVKKNNIANPNRIYPNQVINY